MVFIIYYYLVCMDWYVCGRSISCTVTMLQWCVYRNCFLFGECKSTSDSLYEQYGTFPSTVTMLQWCVYGNAPWRQKSEEI